MSIETIKVLASLSQLTPTELDYQIAKAEELLKTIEGMTPEELQRLSG